MYYVCICIHIYIFTHISVYDIYSCQYIIHMNMTQVHIYIYNTYTIHIHIYVQYTQVYSYIFPVPAFVLTKFISLLGLSLLIQKLNPITQNHQIKNPMCLFGVPTPHSHTREVRSCMLLCEKKDTARHCKTLQDTARHCRYSATTLQLHCNYRHCKLTTHTSKSQHTATTLQQHCNYTATTLQLHCNFRHCKLTTHTSKSQHAAATLQLHCNYTVTTLQLQCEYRHCKLTTHTSKSHTSIIISLCSTKLVYLQHTATHCNTLQLMTHTLIISLCPTKLMYLQHNTTRCSTLQHAAKHCNS